MSKTARHLRATSDRLLRDLDALSTLENEKRNMAPDDPRLVELAARIESVAQRVLGASQTQHALTEQAHEEVLDGQPDAPATTIAETPRDLASILEAWRDAERRLASAEEASVEALEAAVLVERLRSEYHAAHRDTARDTAD